MTNSVFLPYNTFDSFMLLHKSFPHLNPPLSGVESFLELFRHVFSSMPSNNCLIIRFYFYFLNNGLSIQYLMF